MRRASPSKQTAVGRSFHHLVCSSSSLLPMLHSVRRYISAHLEDIIEGKERERVSEGAIANMSVGNGKSRHQPTALSTVICAIYPVHDISSEYSVEETELPQASEHTQTNARKFHTYSSMMMMTMITTAMSLRDTKCTCAHTLFLHKQFIYIYIYI